VEKVDYDKLQKVNI